MKIIDVSTPNHPNAIAIVDDCDYDRLNRFKWTATPRYAIRRPSRKLKNCHKTIHMHHEIMLPPNGMEIDHIDGNGRNNQRHNLRFATRSQNSVNRKRFSGLSRFKGVSWDLRLNLWEVRFKFNKIRHFGGRFKGEIEAAKQYDKIAKKFGGEFACLNFPPDPDLRK